MPFSWWKRVKKMDFMARVGIEVEFVYIVGGEGARGVAVEVDATWWPVRMATQRLLEYSSCFQKVQKSKIL